MGQRLPVIGVCAMDYKARSKPMTNILSHLLQHHEFEVIIFGDHVILEEPVDQWPKCDILISFFSTGFSLQKVFEYCQLVKPYCVNDLVMQELLLDRRLVLEILDAIDVPTPPRIVCNRDLPKVSPEAIRMATRNFGIDFHEVFSVSEPDFQNDAVERGGRVIRKPYVEKPADAENHDVHIYYTDGSGRRLFRKIENKSSEHQEVMSEVRRDERSYIYEKFMIMDRAEDVKVYTIGPSNAYAEIRPSPSMTGKVRRNPEGKEIRHVSELTPEEREIARRICMAFGQTICGFDMLRVNGKSYVIDVNGWSFVKGSEVYEELCAKVLRGIFLTVKPMRDVSRLSGDESQGQWKLKAFIEVMRHADRTPKLKFKMQTGLQEFAELETIEDQQSKLQKALSLSEETMRDLPDGAQKSNYERLIEIIRQKGHLQSTKLQRRATSDGKGLLIVKWGGEFTHAGRHQASDLGDATRKDLSILNKSVLSDVKIACSVERRVQATADVFAKGLLRIAEVPEDLVKIRKDLLDHASVAKPSLEMVRRSLSAELNESKHGPFIRSMLERFRGDLIQMRSIMRDNLANITATDLIHFEWCCSESPKLFQERWEKHFTDLLDTERVEPARISDFYDSLKYDALHNIAFLKRMVQDKNSSQNGETLIRDLFDLTQRLFVYLSPKETGMTADEKVRVSQEIIGPLFRTLLTDLDEAVSSEGARTRLYFTKESHMVALMNLLMHAGLPLVRRRTSSVLIPDELTADPLWYGELDYLSQICFELYEKKRVDKATGKVTSVFSLRIGMSSGAHDAHLLDLHLDRRHCLSVSPKKWLTHYIPAKEAMKLLRGVCS